MDATTIGEALVAKRTDLGLEKGQAAQRIGMSRTTYSSYEQDAQRPSVEVFPAIAEFLGVSMDEVLALYGATCVVQARNFLARVSEEGPDRRNGAEATGSAPISDESPMNHSVEHMSDQSDSAPAQEVSESAISTIGAEVSDNPTEMVDVLSDKPTEMVDVLSDKPTEMVDVLIDKPTEMVDVLSEGPSSWPLREDSSDQKASGSKKKEEKEEEKGLSRPIMDVALPQGLFGANHLSGAESDSGRPEHRDIIPHRSSNLWSVSVNCG